MKCCLLLISIFLLSCTNGGNNPLSSSDSLEIVFFMGHNPTTVKTISTSDKTAIRKVAQFLDEGVATQIDDSSNGRLIFYVDGVESYTVSFNYFAKNSKYFLYMDSTATQPTKMSNEAADFLKGLAEGKSWY